MADNITIPTTGTGTATPAVRTDDIAGVHYQGVKLVEGADGTDDGFISITNPLPVSPLGFPKTIQTDFTRPADVTAYAAGDCISDSTTAPTSGGFTFTGAGRISGGSIIITDVLIHSSNDPATRLAAELFIFNQAVTNVNDNSAFVVSDTEIKTCVGVVPFSLFDSGNNQFAHVSGLNILCTCVGTANLRFLVRARNAYTPANAEVLTFTIKGLQVD